jgi:hypothetical protein
MILCGNQHILWSVFREVVIWLNRTGIWFRAQRMELVNSIQEIIGRHVCGDGDVADTVSQLHVLLRLIGLRAQSFWGLAARHETRITGPGTDTRLQSYHPGRLYGRYKILHSTDQ